MIFLFLIFVFMQATVILVDEFYCHRRRDIPAWERWGHPLDTLFFLLPLALLALVPSLPVWGYILGAFFSCLFITKDEWVHSKLCTPFEHWLHAILFILHPLVLVFAWQIHWERSDLIIWILPPISLFFIYQLIYWNLYESTSVRS